MKVLRLLVSIVWTGIAGFVVIPGGILRTLSLPLGLKVSTVAGHIWGKGICWILGVKVSVQGPLPPKGVVVVANHWSWLDIPVLYSVFPGCFISRHEVAGWIGFGVLARAGGTLFVVRGKRAGARKTIEEMGEWLGAGARVVFFPEGRAWNGKEILHFKSTLFSAPINSGKPCVPIGLAYDSREAAWASEMSFPEHFASFCASGGCEARIFIGDPVVPKGSRKEMAATLRKSVAALSGLPLNMD